MTASAQLHTTGTAWLGSLGPAGAGGLAAAVASLGGLAVVAAHPSGVTPRENIAEIGVESVDAWFYWDFHPSIVIGIVALIVLYTVGITWWRVRFALSDRVPVGKAVMFYSNCLLLWFILDGPLHHLSDELLFTGHMVQHLLLQLLWGQLFVLSIPSWLMRPVLQAPLVLNTLKFLTRPRNAFIAFNGMTVLWHIPALYNLALYEHNWHIIQHLCFMSTAVMFWWPIHSQVPELPKATYGWRMLYILANMAPMKALGIFITLHNEVIYTYYLTVPRTFGLTALGDQRAGGLLMWVPSSLFLWVAVGVTFFKWHKRGTPKRGMTGIAHLDEPLTNSIAPGESS